MKYHHLPLTPGFFSILVGLFLLVPVLLRLGALRYAYMRLGVSSRAAMLLPLASLVGSDFDLPVAQPSGGRVLSGEVVDFFGMRCVAPVVENWPGTVIAVNVGGAVIPAPMSFHLIGRHGLWIRGPLATAALALVIHWRATPVRGAGIAVPVFIPALVTAVVAIVLARERAAPSPTWWVRSARPSALAPSARRWSGAAEPARRAVGRGRHTGAAWICGPHRERCHRRDERHRGARWNARCRSKGKTAGARARSGRGHFACWAQ